MHGPKCTLDAKWGIVVDSGSTLTSSGRNQLSISLCPRSLGLVVPFMWIPPSIRRSTRTISPRQIVFHRYVSPIIGLREMSGSTNKQEPRIVKREELETSSKWMKLEKIHWEDQEGKAVGHRDFYFQAHSDVIDTVLRGWTGVD